MVHAVSASYLRSERMSPSAMALAVLVHALVVIALISLPQLRPTPRPEDTPIEVIIERPKPPEPKVEPPPQSPPEPKVEQAPPPPPVLPNDLRPPAPIVSDKPTQVPTPNTNVREMAPPQTAPVTEPQQQTPPPEPPKPEPPKVEAPKPTPPPRPEPPKPAPSPLPHALAVPPANPLPRPSPLSRPQQQRQAATTPGPDQPTPSPFVNPADTYARARIQDNYLWEVVRKLQGYTYQANVTAAQGVTSVRIVIARDGRLLSVEIVSPSGQPEMDRGVLQGVRAGSPYTPLPPEIKGESATFTLPLVSTRQRGG